jgi:hypothetical protein
MDTDWSGIAAGNIAAMRSYKPNPLLNERIPDNMVQWLQAARQAPCSQRRSLISSGGRSP